jgi:hypothetical protein
LIQIDTEKRRIDWNAIRADYIAGGCSYRKLAGKYNITKDAIARKAKSEGWDKDRDKVRVKSATKVIQKTADAVADNAVIAERIKTKLLQRLEKEIDSMPDSVGTERSENGKKYKLLDMAHMWKELTDDMPKDNSANNALLQSLLDLERSAGK